MSKFCTEVCKPCPEPIQGRGPGESRCEQTGVCQLVNFDALPTLSAMPIGGNGIRLKVIDRRDR